MKSLPKISVVIPVLNSVKTIEKAIQSVIDQHYENVELIILDAGSTDGTIDILKRYQSYIYYWHSRPDGSSGHAINLGIQQSTGDLIAQLMADDWFEPKTFTAIAQAYVENSQADIISCGGRTVCYDEKLKQYKPIMTYTTASQLDLSLYNMCFGIPAMSCRFLTKTFIKSIGLMEAFDEDGKHHFSADRELLLRAAVLGCKNVIIQHLGHTYFAHAESATFGKKRCIQMRIYQEHMALVERYLQRYVLSPEQRSILSHWYYDQAIRLFIFQLLAGDVLSAGKIARKGLKKSTGKWLSALFSTPCRILAKKGYLYFLQKIKNKQHV